MGVLMDLIAGDAREILLAISVDDWAGLRDRSRFVAYISLGGGLDMTWLDLLALAARETIGSESPGPFTLATHSLDGRVGDASDRTVERVDPHWIDAVARLPESRIDRIAARWIDLVECEGCDVDPEEKPMFRELAGDLVDFCRRAEGAEDVLFAWSLWPIGTGSPMPLLRISNQVSSKRGRPELRSTRPGRRGNSWDG